MNVLLTCAGRRTSLLAAVQKAVRPYDGKVFAGDCASLAPALYLADAAFPLPRCTSPDYVPRLLALTREHEISLIVPTIDPELPVLAQATADFEALGCRVLISSTDFIHLAADKWATVQTYSTHGICTVPSWLPTELADDALPQHLVVKPRSGSASRHVFSIDRTLLDHALALVPEPLVQQAIDAPEITVDALFDFTGRLLHYVPRRRLRTRAGESTQGVTLPDDELRPWLVEVLEVSGKLGALGPLTLQAFLTENGPMLSEINARFAGGFPLTEAAGGHYPQWILHLLQGKTITPKLGAYTQPLYMTRHDVELFFEQPLWP